MKALNNFIEVVFDFKWSIYIVLFIASLVVFLNIGRESLELDEIFSATVALKSSSLGKMFSEYISRDGSPPLFHILLFYWGKIFGSGDIAIRLMSYLFTLLGILCSYLLLDKYLSRKMALIFSTLSAFTPGVLFYAQQARMYALLYALASIISVIFCIYILRIKDNLKIDKQLFIYYFFSGTLICYTHHFGSVLVFSLSVFAIIYSLVFKRMTDMVTISFVSVFIGIIALSWPVFQFYYVDMEKHIKVVSWTRNNVMEIMLNFSTLLALNKYGIVFLLILLLPFSINIDSLIKLVKRYTKLLVPVMLVLVLSYFIGLWLFVISERYLIVIIPLILLFLSFIFLGLYENKRQYILFYMVGLLILGTYKSFSYRKQNWRDASKYIENNFKESNCIVPIKSLSTSTFSKLPYVSYYLGSEYTYELKGPQVQDDCDLIYIDGHTNIDGIKKALIDNNISIPYKIIDFNKVYIVVKK